MAGASFTEFFLIPGSPKPHHRTLGLSQTHLSLWAIKLNFPSILYGLLIDKNWAIVFKAQSARAAKKSFT